MEKHSKQRITVIILGMAVAALCVSGVLLFAILPKFMPAEFSPPAPASGDNTGYYRHCYEELGENEKLSYAVILSQISTLPEKIEVPSMGEGELDRVFLALSYDNPDLFFLGLSSTLTPDGRKTWFSVDYTMTSADYQTKLGELRTAAAAVTAGAAAFSSDYEKELYVHDYLVNHCTYTNEAANTNANTAYGCLVEGKASCEGYSRAFQYLLNLLNLDNRLVTGEASDRNEAYIGHMWNYAVIDGIPYFVDVTWDDPSAETGVLRHTYFNITTQELLKRHRALKQTLPLCTDNKYNYFRYEGTYVETADASLSEQVENALYQAKQRGYRCAEFRFADVSLQKWAVDYLLDSHTGVIYGIYQSAGLFTDESKHNVYYSSDEDTGTLCLYF